MDVIAGDLANVPSDAAIVNSMVLEPTDDYADVLKYFGLKYKRTDYYLEVGEPAWEQGWILDISVVEPQLFTLLSAILPLIISKSCSFKIPTSIRKAHALVCGDLGWWMLGKVVSIYPVNNGQAVELARDLIELTKPFRCPEIPTDQYLGGTIYTRYGAGKQITHINEWGSEERFVYNKKGQLEKEVQVIPFQMPNGIEWPFSEMSALKISEETVLQDRYRPIRMLKADPKGAVKKGLWLRKIYWIRWCVLKEGRKNMLFDEYERDIVDRLRWQFELHKDLEGAVPLPKMYDFFEENGNGYLAMEYIHGVSLHEVIEPFFRGMVWGNIPLPKRVKLLTYALQVLDIIGIMHSMGYIHRDITSSNFLIDKRDKLWMIDLELSYSVILKKPFPPFRLGTPGFMSPEQELTHPPSIEQDIYSIGALLLEILTGFQPDHFVKNDKAIAVQQLGFFIPDPVIVDTVSSCFSLDPSRRPDILTLRNSVDNFFDRQSFLPQVRLNTDYPLREERVLNEFIGHALEGLVRQDMINNNKLWLSKGAGDDGIDPKLVKPVAVYEGFCDGVSGVIWLLSVAKKLGFCISSCEVSQEKSLAFILDLWLKKGDKITGGLYIGSAGIAIALANALDTQVIPSNDQLIEQIMACAGNKNIDGCGIVTGLAGQGMALLRISPVLKFQSIQSMIERIVSLLISQQQPDGSWIIITTKNRKEIKSTGFGHGVAGIVCFLLCYIKQFDASLVVKQSVSRALEWILRQAYKVKGITRWHVNNRSNTWTPDFQDGSLGVMLSLIKAFEVFGADKYQGLAEDCLRNYPTESVSWNLTLANGISGYGQVLLNGANTFNDGEWRKRADWVAEFFLHYFRKDKNDAIFWVSDGSLYPTASLLQGNCGIIHFLLRYNQQARLFHPLLAN